MTDPLTGWLLILLVVGMAIMPVIHMLQLLGPEWLRSQFERLTRRREQGRPDDDDEDPRGGFGGLAS
jgi:hypothetical protein